MYSLSRQKTLAPPLKESGSEDHSRSDFSLKLSTKISKDCQTLAVSATLDFWAI